MAENKYRLAFSPRAHVLKVGDLPAIDRDGVELTDEQYQEALEGAQSVGLLVEPVPQPKHSAPDEEEPEQQADETAEDAAESTDTSSTEESKEVTE